MDDVSIVNYIVVIGASAGGVEALSSLVAGLPEDLPAPVLITHHQSPQSQSMMPAILSRAGKIHARTALNNQPLEPGHIYVAPPDQHLLVKEGRVILGRGPKENSTRPAIDPLFRTAAAAYGSGVISVILSGNLDDGTAGMAAVKECGGIAIVQDPAEASYPGMPESAIQNVAVDYILPVAEIGRMIGTLLNGFVLEKGPVTVCEQATDDGGGHTDPAEGVAAAITDTKEWGNLSGYACPDCHGTLWETDTNGILRFRCRIGHAYSSGSLAAQMGDRVEEALWTALRALQERSALAERLAARCLSQNKPKTAARFKEQKDELDSQSTLLLSILQRGQADSVTSEKIS